VQAEYNNTCTNQTNKLPAIDIGLDNLNNVSMTTKESIK